MRPIPRCWKTGARAWRRPWPRAAATFDRDSSAFAREVGLNDTEAVATLFELISRGEARMDRSGAVETIILTAPPCGDAAAPAQPPAISK